jgi:hypothetical protein
MEFPRGCQALVACQWGKRYPLSPDAAKVAISRYTTDGQRGVSVTIVTLATGVSRIWTLPFALDPQTTASTWSADSQRFEVTWQNSPSLTEYTSQVSLATPGSRLPQPRALTLPAGLRPYVLGQWAAANCDLFFVNSSYQAPTWRLVSYSAQTGEFSHLLGPVRATTQPLVAWSSGNGQVLIIYGHDGGLGALGDGHYTPLPFTGLARQPQASLVW